MLSDYRIEVDADTEGFMHNTSSTPSSSSWGFRAFMKTLISFFVSYHSLIISLVVGVYLVLQ